MSVTLSVPEILMDVLDAFKLETPELFQPGGFARDFSSKTAVLGDKITAHLSHVPVTGAYQVGVPQGGGAGGFYGASQDVTTLIEDVPISLNQLRIVTVKLAWLTQLSSKLPLYKEATRNYGYALGKYVVDTALAQAPAEFSNAVNTNTSIWNLDAVEVVRNQLNSQHAQGRGRFMFLNSALSSALGQDDRVRSSLEYGQLNGENGFRRWTNLAGFKWVREYPDLPPTIAGVAGDSRAFGVCVRNIETASDVADQLGVPKVMEFYPTVDQDSGVSITGVTWQEVGTGDMYLSAAILFGVNAGNQGGTPGTMTDNAGCLITTH